MENNTNFDQSDHENNNQNQDVDEILESEINEEDYQFTEKGFEPDKK